MKKRFLIFALTISVLIHIFIVAIISIYFEISKDENKEIEKNTLIRILIEKLEPVLPPPPPPPPKKKKEVEPQINLEKVEKETVEEAEPSIEVIETSENEENQEVEAVFGVSEKDSEEKETGREELKRGNTLTRVAEKESSKKGIKRFSKISKEAKTKKEDRFSPVPLKNLAVAPKVIDPAKPLYPRVLEEEEIEGKVTLRLSISKEGKVVNIQVVKSDHALFTEAAVLTAKNYRFSPGKTKDGIHVDTVVEFTITFEMPL
ncbi:MAG: energy transducer TonB [bacterium]